MKTLRQQAIDPVNGVRVRIRADLQRLVVVGQPFFHEHCHVPIRLRKSSSRCDCPAPGRSKCNGCSSGGEGALRVRKHRFSVANLECLTEEARGLGPTRQLKPALDRGCGGQLGCTTRVSHYQDCGLGAFGDRSRRPFRQWTSALVRVWPVTAGVIHWPPRISFSDDGGGTLPLRTLVRRVARCRRSVGRTGSADGRRKRAVPGRETSATSHCPISIAR